MTTVFYSSNFDTVWRYLKKEMVHNGHTVDTGQWQSTTAVPMTKTIELTNVMVQLDINPTSGAWGFNVKPNLPWAEEHFQERVSGKPLNPPPSAARWPFAQAGHEGHTADGKFSHTYPERLWGQNRHITTEQASTGIIPAGFDFPLLLTSTQEIATLDDLVNLLIEEPYTRQAFIPIWWPIDGKMAGHERVPCTLGYHFMLRDGHLNCFYPMRSCDLLRHFPDDAYMAGRLTQWVIEQCRMCLPDGAENWHSVVPGTLTMFMSSLHVFEGEQRMLANQLGIRP